MNGYMAAGRFGVLFAVLALIAGACAREKKGACQKMMPNSQPRTKADG